MARQLKYDQVLFTIMELIGKSQLQPGDRLPAERKLLEQMDCSMITLRRALSTLVQRGVLERRQGSGTFLCHSLGGTARAGKVLYINVNIKGSKTSGSSEGFEELISVFHSKGLEMEYLSVYEFTDSISAAAQHVQGVLVYGAFTPSFLKALQALGLPTILIGGKYRKDKPFPQVTLNARQSTAELTQYFLNQGSRKLLLLNSDPAYYMSREIEEGFQLGMQQTDHRGISSTCISIHDEGEDELLARFHRLHEFDTIIMEIGIYHRFLAACRTLNCVVPIRVGVIPRLQRYDSNAKYLFRADRNTVFSRLSDSMYRVAAEELCKAILHGKKMQSYCLTTVIDDGTME